MGVKYLLDTHVLLWLELQPQMLGSSALDIVQDVRNPLYVSAISAFEISQKQRVGKLDVQGFPQCWDMWLRESQLLELPLRAVHAIYAGAMQWDHRDPFDRLIVAQAQLEDMVLMTADSRILGLPLLPAFDARR